MPVHSTTRKLKASDLRSILEYVPLYRGQIFVVSIDGSVIECENFSNLATDIAVLKSLGIRVVIVHGIGRQMKDLAKSCGVEISDAYGNAPVDDKTLDLARTASAKALQKIQEAFAVLDMRCASTNAVRATEVGIVSGVDYLNAGRIDKIDADTLDNLLRLDIIPVISPIAVNRKGRLFRLNSDMLAAEISTALSASKLIYMTETKGLAVGGETAVSIPLNKAAEVLESRREKIDARVFDKVKYAVKALSSGRTPRAHILDGREFASLLNEVFEKVGSGTMIYADEYQKIRKAEDSDANTIYNLSQNSTKEQNLVKRTLEEISQKISTYFVYEMDGSIIAFVSLLDLGEGCAELASLHVQPFYQGNSVGTTMVEYVKKIAKERGFKTLFALSTKSAPFFKDVCEFDEVPPETLPQARLEKYRQSKRNSKVFKIGL
ncbi:MAG: amino-acid N-acetyltransferase [Opitutales bacterium]|nr:amino-acid N-acetyltransferase [Opitutales bacterium]